MMQAGICRGTSDGGAHPRGSAPDVPAGVVRQATWLSRAQSAAAVREATPILA